MRLISLKARILLGAFLWTVGLFMIAVIFINFTHEGGQLMLHHRAAPPMGPDPGYLLRTLHSTPHGVALKAIIAAVCMYGGFLQVRRGMSPINQLRNRLAAVHKGIDGRMGGAYPAEVQPLVDDLNALLDERERRVARAVAKASDLAHGLKTPLAVLALEAQQARTAGHEQLATEINQQIDRMQRQIDYHLAHARSAASSATPGARASVPEAAEGLVRVLQRLYSERNLQIEIDGQSAPAFRGQREDLDEMLGNLLDNACKWARAQVALTCSKDGDMVMIVVDDDGPGISPSMREAILQRGFRADERVPGSGLGLAIVRDVAEIYGGSISLDASPIGGARARLILPAGTE